jgi:hypothetical protein
MRKIDRSTNTITQLGIIGSVGFESGLFRWAKIPVMSPWFKPHSNMEKVKCFITNHMDWTVRLAMSKKTEPLILNGSILYALRLFNTY